MSKPIPHGTTTGYRRGCRCDECREANTRSLRDWRANPKNRARDRKRLRATGRALWRLAGQYPDDYARYYAEELAAEFQDGAA